MKIDGLTVQDIIDSHDCCNRECPSDCVNCALLPDPEHLRCIDRLQDYIKYLLKESKNYLEKIDTDISIKDIRSDCSRVINNKTK